MKERDRVIEAVNVFTDAREVLRGVIEKAYPIGSRIRIRRHIGKTSFPATVKQYVAPLNDGLCVSVEAEVYEQFPDWMKCHPKDSFKIIVGWCEIDGA